jgi:hypothetical protein
MKERCDLKKVAFSLILLSVGLYILIPTLDEFMIHPVFGVFLFRFFDLPYIYGIAVSIIMYRVAGVICLIAAIIIGGRSILEKLKTKFRNFKHSINL